MPLYEYQCKKCGHKFEKIQLFSDKPIKKCPECGGAVEKLISRSAVQFKGSGWYATDYAKSGGSGSGSGGAAKGADEGGASADPESSVVRDSKTPAASEGKEPKPKAKSESSEKKSSKK